MKLASRPARVPVPFADQGTKNAIPVNSQIGVKDGAASYTDGFPPLTMTPIAAGGIPPAGGDFNGILNAITQSVRWACAGGQYAYDDAFSTAIGGYPKGALIQNAAGDVIWLNTVDDNKTNPDTGTGWSPAIRYGLTTVALAGSNVTLTPAQAAKETIVLTGTLTANVQLIMPAWVETWLIVNNTTGNFTVAVKPAAGSGVNLAASTSSQVYGDGTNIYYGALMVRNNLAEIKAAGTNSQTAARGNIGCGTAAAKDFTTQYDDTNSGRLMMLGCRGIGGSSGDMLPGADINTAAKYLQFLKQYGGGIYRPIWNSAVTNPDGLTKYSVNFFGNSGDTFGLISIDYGTGKVIAVGANQAGIDSGKVYVNELYGKLNKPTAGDVGAIPLSGSTAVNGILRNSAEFQTTSANSYRMVYGNYGVFWRQDGSSLYLMVTNSGDQYGTFNSLRPLTISLTNGYPTMSRLNLTDWTNFDARYQAKGSYTPAGQAYTKAESDARYQKINTASRASNGWYKDTNTGMITQWGTVSLPATNGKTTSASFSFATAFPNAVLSMVATPGNSRVNNNGFYSVTAVTGLTSSGGTISADSNAGESFSLTQIIRYIAIGY